MTNTQRLLVLRFSAMGDVAMVASVLKEFNKLHPSVEIIVVSRPAFKAFFENIPQLVFHPFYPKKEHKGIFGLWRLFSELRAYKITGVADLHDNIRSRVVSFFFRFLGVPIRRIDKGRSEKKALVREENKVLIPLKLTVERYADVFKHLGFTVELSHQLVLDKKELPVSIRKNFSLSDGPKIGISPFAQHPAKMYSLEKMEQVISLLSQWGASIFIFGGGEKEKQFAGSMSEKYNQVSNVIGSYNLTEELAIISNLDLMISMDSSGMHMASLMGVPVISIWGGTHPYAGFIGYGQRISDCLQLDHPIRPNSVYGNKACDLNGVPIIDYIEFEVIVNAVKQRLTENYG